MLIELTPASALTFRDVTLCAGKMIKENGEVWYAYTSTAFTAYGQQANQQ